MANIDVRPPQKRQRCGINDDEDDNGNGNDNEKVSIDVASITDSGRVASISLEDSLLFRIAEFLSPADAAVVCKLFFEATTETSESVLNRIDKHHHVDADWRLRLAQHVLDRYKHFYFGNDDTAAAEANQHPTLRVNPTLHPRLLWQSADKIPLAQRSK